MRRVAALALVVALGSCTGGRDDERGVTALPEAEDALDEPLMIALAQARNYHHKADVLLAEARLDDAIGALRELLAIRFPAGAPEADDVVHDARARLAKLLVTKGAIDEALAVVDAGLAGAPRPSFFLANLHTARGEVLEAHAQLATGDAARAARRQAIEAFDRSIAINRDLLRGLVDEATP